MQWLPCPLAIWNLLFGMAILLINEVEEMARILDKSVIVPKPRRRNDLGCAIIGETMSSRSSLLNDIFT